ncbi:methyl-accepting chemotaxis protein [Desulfonatronum lacustre]|uniref:methyl-accepting chemotaxis protein n=1 Tax=Desulfonatronum lacustre TaxID=66849 RepID=UPI0004B14D45|nr:methyl-accepting chemotaxis protein [Desulfonatronum lacustre]
MKSHLSLTLILAGIFLALLVLSLLHGTTLAELRWALIPAALLSLGAVLGLGHRRDKNVQRAIHLLRLATDTSGRPEQADLPGSAPNSPETIHFPNLDGLERELAGLVSAYQDVVRRNHQETAKRHSLSGQLQSTSTALSQTLSGAEQARCGTIRSAVDVLRESVGGITREAEKLKAAVDQADQGAQRQQRHTIEAAAAMEQMNASILEAARHAGDASTSSSQARSRAEAGARIVRETLDAVTAVADKGGELSGSIAELGRQAETIDGIMDVISDIADQTNLLALNAAIEAARAGNAGRGFAVVADEVRKLAEKTMNATKDVGHEVQAIQTRVRKAVQEVRETMDLVDKTVALSNESGASLAEIVDLSQESALQAQSIAEAVHQQSKASEEITRTLTEVSSISTTTQDDMSRSLSEIDNLSRRVRDLITLTRVFELIGKGAVQELVDSLARSKEVLSLDRKAMETTMRETVRRNNFLELLYITDAQGIQLTANIPRPSLESSSDRNAFGKDWSARPWFTEAMRTPIPYISNVYTSQASGEPCITVSTPFRDAEGRILGVIAADVRVQ